MRTLRLGPQSHGPDCTPATPRHMLHHRAGPDPAYGLTQVANREEVTSSGDDRARTDDPRLAKAVLSQLSYVPSPSSSPIRPRATSRGGRKRWAGKGGGHPIWAAGAFRCYNTPRKRIPGGCHVRKNRIATGGRRPVVVVEMVAGENWSERLFGRTAACPMARTGGRCVAGCLGRRDALSGVWVCRVRRILCRRAATSVPGGSAAAAGRWLLASRHVVGRARRQDVLVRVVAAGRVRGVVAGRAGDDAFGLASLRARDGRLRVAIDPGRLRGAGPLPPLVRPIGAGGQSGHRPGLRAAAGGPGGVRPVVHRGEPRPTDRLWRDHPVDARHAAGLDPPYLADVAGSGRVGGGAMDFGRAAAAGDRRRVDERAGRGRGSAARGGGFGALRRCTRRFATRWRRWSCCSPSTWSSSSRRCGGASSRRGFTTRATPTRARRG